jgi:hypothetical protein
MNDFLQTSNSPKVYRRNDGNPMIFIFALLCFFNSDSILAQGRNTIESSYLNEAPPGDIPKSFASGMIKLEHSFHIILSFYPDQKEIYWLAFSPENLNSAVINYIQFDGEKWKSPESLNIAKGYGVYTLHISPDGNRLYFTSNMPSPDIPGDNLKLWFCEREGDKWGGPKTFQKNINNITGVSSTFNGTLYTNGIKRSKKVGKDYSDWEEVHSNLNIGKSTGGNPYISPKEDYILFGQKTPSEMYISFKTINGDWTPPINLNEEMNIETASSQPIVSPDGKYLFYYVNEDKHLHWVSTRRIKELQSNIVK